MRFAKLLVVMVFLCSWASAAISGRVVAPDRTVKVNDDFLTGIPIDSDPEILIVSLDPKDLPHGDDDAELCRR